MARTSCLQQSKVTDAKCERETRWVYYDRENYQVYRKAGDAKAIELVDEGRHALALQHRVPVFEMKVSEGLWLMNKAALLQLEHFNKSNALSWALTMGLFASPVVFSDREWNQVVGESYFIQLGKEDRFGWTEPEGKVYQIAADNLVRLKDEIYRVCYLMSQAGTSSGERCADERAEQATRLRRDAGGAARVRGHGEGHDEAGAAGDRGGSPG